MNAYRYALSTKTVSLAKEIYSVKLKNSFLEN
jgi:hypothetical protein